MGRILSSVGLCLVIIGWFHMTKPQLSFNQLSISPKIKNWLVRVFGAILIALGVVLFLESCELI